MALASPVSGTNCVSCKRAGDIIVPFNQRRYCGRHFVELIERRVRKSIRTGDAIDEKRAYAFVEDGSKESCIARMMLESVFSGRLRLCPVRHVGWVKDVRKGTSKGRMATIVPTNLDRQATIFLDALLGGKPLPKKKKGVIHILDDVLDDELVVLAKIWRIPAVPEIRHPILDAIEKKHPGSAFALRRSMDDVAGVWP